jgi:hypothetical protein
LDQVTAVRLIDLADPDILKSMRPHVLRRLLVIALLLSRLMLGNVMHVPAAQAESRASGETTPMVMTAHGGPCHEHGSVAMHPKLNPAAATPRHVLTDDGACCKSAKCFCLHAPALTTAVCIPAVFRISDSAIASPAARAAIGGTNVLFRPPIETLPADIQ